MSRTWYPIMPCACGDCYMSGAKRCPELDADTDTLLREIKAMEREVRAGNVTREAYFVMRDRLDFLQLPTIKWLWGSEEVRNESTVQTNV